MRFVSILWLFLSMSPSFATDIAVGGSLIEIPTPVGFAPVVAEMTEVSELQRHFVPAGNEQLAIFIDENEVSEALSGGSPL